MIEDSAFHRPGSFFQTLRDKSNRDMVLFILLLTLTFTGLVVLYGASSFISYRESDDSDYIFGRQLVWFFAGLPLMFTAALIPLKKLRLFALPGILLAILLLVMVFVPGVGHSVSSHRESFHRWIGFGGFTFQPSEFAKAALVLFSAAALARQMEEGREIRKLFVPASLVSLVLVLIVFEPQYGTFLCIFVVLLTLLYISGFSLWRLVTFFLALLPVLGTMIYFWEYRLERLKVWLDPWAHRHEGGYQLVTSFRAFARGGMAGRGYRHRLCSSLSHLRPHRLYPGSFC